MVISVEMNATKAVSINQLVQQIINPWCWVLIRSCLLVESPTVYVHPLCKVQPYKCTLSFGCLLCIACRYVGLAS